MEPKVIGWAVWISKPNYMVDREEFFKSEGYEWEDVRLYARTLEDITSHLISVSEYIELQCGDFYENHLEGWQHAKN